jgi:transglutaminase-like putative cysteine protease
MNYKIRHVTTYAYSEPVLVAHHMAHLTPRNSASQTLRRSSLRISPTLTGAEDRRLDYFGNPVSYFAIQTAHRSLSVEATSRVEVRPREIPVPEDTPSWEDVAAILSGEAGEAIPDAAEFCYDSTYISTFDALTRYAALSFPSGRPVLSAAIDLMHRIYHDFTYDPTATTVATALDDVLEDRRGVCQDFAHLGIAALRTMGLAARYVSGYVLTHPAPGKKRLKGADASHAWFSLFIPGSGWIDFDPTNDRLPDIEHVVTAWGRDYDDVSPLRGVVLGGGEHSLKVSVNVEPVGP